jgi:hypothetical protein
MPILATEGESKPRIQSPPGSHAARCISVIDLGTQETPYGDAHKVRITWELPEEKAVFKEENGEQPFVLSKDYTLSLYEKANLRHDLESWRGRAFTEQELKGFDISKLLGATCMLSVVHKTTDKGKTFANISAVSALPKGMQCPPMINSAVEYSISDGENDTYRAFPEWLRKKIASAHEWGNGSGPRLPEEEEDGGIPF